MTELDNVADTADQANAGASANATSATAQAANVAIEDDGNEQKMLASPGSGNTDADDTAAGDNVEDYAPPTGAAGDSSQTAHDGQDNHDPCKMFIGGLSWQTTADSLREHFAQFGELTECMVMRDPATRRARGFGFITFADASSVDKVLAQHQHDLDGKKIDPKPAFPKQKQAKMITRTKKIFIGGLAASSSVDDMKAYFEQFGKIEDAMLMFDKSTQRHRGFGFVTFESEDVVEKVCEIHFHEINGKMVECKKAQPKEVMLPLQLSKNRAAAARSLYGIAPEQLLAQYAAMQPRAAYGAFGAHNLYYPVLGSYHTAMAGQAQFAPVTPTSPTGAARFGHPQHQQQAGATPAALTGLEALYAPQAQHFDMSASYHAAAAAAAAAANAAAAQSPQAQQYTQQQQQAFNTPQLIAAAYNGYH